MAPKKRVAYFLAVNIQRSNFPDDLMFRKRAWKTLSYISQQNSTTYCYNFSCKLYLSPPFMASLEGCILGYCCISFRA